MACYRHVFPGGFLPHRMPSNGLPSSNLRGSPPPPLQDIARVPSLPGEQDNEHVSAALPRHHTSDAAKKPPSWQYRCLRALAVQIHRHRSGRPDSTSSPQRRLPPLMIAHADASELRRETRAGRDQTVANGHADFYEGKAISIQDWKAPSPGNAMLPAVCSVR